MWKRGLDHTITAFRHIPHKLVKPACDAGMLGVAIITLFPDEEGFSAINGSETSLEPLKDRLQRLHYHPFKVIGFSSI